MVPVNPRNIPDILTLPNPCLKPTLKCCQVNPYLCLRSHVYGNSLTAFIVRQNAQPVNI